MNGSWAIFDQGNLVVVIEHNLDVIKVADWIIGLGPEGGVRGGRSSRRARPSRWRAIRAASPGKYLAPLLERGRVAAE